MNYTINHICASYNPNYKPFESNANNTKEYIEQKNILTYKELIRDYFVNEFADSPDAQTVLLIEELREKVSIEVGLEIDKARATGKKQRLLEKSDDKKESIITTISFYKQWLNLNEPSIENTLILSQWEDKPDFKLLLEKLLAIQLLEKEHLNLSYPNSNERRKRIIKKREEEDKQKKDAVDKIVNEYVLYCFANRITDSEITRLMGVINELFEKGELRDVKPINNIKDLKTSDLKYCLYRIWEKYDIALGIKLKQETVAKYLFNQFPTSFKESETIDSITKHFTRPGKIIKGGKI